MKLKNQCFAGGTKLSLMPYDGGIICTDNATRSKRKKSLLMKKLVVKQVSKQDKDHRLLFSFQRSTRINADDFLKMVS